MQKTILAFGEVLWDLLPSGPVLGGAPCNFAYRINSLGDRAVMISRLGRDELGRKAALQLAALGLDTSCIQWDEARPTGTVKVSLDAQGAPDFTILPDAAYDQLAATDTLLGLAATADAVCYGTLIQRSWPAREALHRLLPAAPKAIKLLDLNLRKHCYSGETLLAALERADILKLNEDEARYLAAFCQVDGAPLSAFCAQILERCLLSHCVVTLGERGVFAVSSREERVYVPGFQVQVVDTVGSGDAFTAGFLHALLRGQSLAECCRLGNALGALVATQSGATQPIGRETLSDFLAAPPPPVVDETLRAAVGNAP
jgi:fructokinase